MPRFCHETEEFFAALLDHHGIKWEYENKTFIIKVDEEGEIKRAFCPDFYLPEYDTYIELTVMRRPRRKEKKIRDVKNLYPETNIVLLTRDSINELIDKYKFISEPLTTA